MKLSRRRFRNFIGQLVGVQADLDIWWTPEIPVVYISNPKAGCSTIKQSLKNAQAGAYAVAGRRHARTFDPHVGDDCLRNKGLAPGEHAQRYLFSCVRNPFARTLSAYLDRVLPQDPRKSQEFRHRAINSFEDYLRALADFTPILMDPHFRPQHINLNYPALAYDAVFFLENCAAISRFVTQIAEGFELKTHAPHSRDAASKLREHYDSTTVGLVRQIYAEDFRYFGYSQKLDDALLAPGELIYEDRLIPHPAGHVPLPAAPRQATSGDAFERSLRYRRLIDMRLL